MTSNHLGTIVGRLMTIVVVAAVVAYGAVLASYQVTRRRAIRKLESGSQVVITPAGPIEYAINGTGPTVLVLPGSFGGYDQALTVGRNLGPGFSVLAVSRPGYLRTPIDVGRRPEEQADAYVGLLDSLHRDKVAVLAISGGGPSALEFARRHGDRVSALVLIAALSGPKAQPPAVPSRNERWLDRMFGSGFGAWWQLRALERSGTKALESPIFSPDTRARLAQDSTKLRQFFDLAWFRFPPDRRSAGYRNDREQFGSFRFTEFALISSPTLVVHGTMDRNAPIEHGDRSATIPGAEYLKIEGGDHYASIARAEEVWPRVVSFLRQETAGQR
jgi:pimeloyl-ACP methyl ester carboxylesterase